jgi:predicted ATPase
LIELLKTYFEITAEDDERKRREKVGGKVLMLDRSLEDTLPYLFTLLGLDDPTATLQQMDPQIRRRRTFEALKRLFWRESLNQPLILIFEDLHWIDSETQGFLDLLSESVASVRLLVLVNYRPEYRHEWGHKTYYTQLRLAPLGKEEAEELLSYLLGNDSSLTGLKRLVLEKTESTPFFMEEVVQTLTEEGVLNGARGQYRLVRAPTEIHISPTVQGVLAARIDRLSQEEKELLQHLAVIGREFPVSLVRQVIRQPEAELYRVLAALQNKEFLYEQPAFPEVEYLFKHALTQEVAYNSVLHERRRTLHERTAQAIEVLYQGRLEEHYSQLAHHYSRSGNTAKAVEYLHLAGQQAVQRSAYAEAISHLSSAVELLTTLPDTSERARQELALQITLGVPLIATTGYASPDVERVYARAHTLCQQVGETPQLFSVLWGLWGFHVVRAEYTPARALGEQCLLLAQSVRDPVLLLEAHRILGETILNLGEFPTAQQHFEDGLALYQPQQHHSLASLYGGEDPGVVCRCMLSAPLWLCGYPDRALKSVHDALALARELAHPYSLAWGLYIAAANHQLRREERAVHEWADAAISLATEQGFPLWVAMGAMLRGWALAEQGQGEEGIAQLRQGLAAYRATGAEEIRAYFLALLAEACGKAGQAEEGLSVLAEALAFVHDTGERFHEAELYRLKGELTLQQQVHAPSSEFNVASLQHRTPNTQAEAEACFLKAIEIARRQSAKSLELRAVMNLSRLWQQQGKKAEARQLLAEIYGWFTEGFDTKDLQEAKALLEELA